jgi:hypothetical protein
MLDLLVILLAVFVVSLTWSGGRNVFERPSAWSGPKGQYHRDSNSRIPFAWYIMSSFFWVAVLSLTSSNAPHHANCVPRPDFSMREVDSISLAQSLQSIS